MSYKIAVLAGDGIGPEIMEEALKCLKVIEEKTGTDFEIKEALVGGAAWDVHKEHLPKDTLDICKESDAILFGSVGGPVEEQDKDKWKGVEKTALLGLRKEFRFFANLRPAKLFNGLENRSSLRKDIAEKGFDIMVIRELTGGIYFGEKGREGSGDEEFAFDKMKYTRKEVKRIAHTAFKFAMKRGKKITSIDKANVLTTMVFWREVVEEVAKEYPEVKYEPMYVDNAAMQLTSNPSRFDVMLCPNMFGDILSDQAAAITGSLGMLPSASLNEDGFGMYEPSGGSAPDIAGKKIANPIAQILCVAMMLKHSFGMQKESEAIEKAVEKVLEEEKIRTPDLGGENSTSELGDAIAEEIKKNL